MAAYAAKEDSRALSPRVLAAALAKVTEVLARELANPSDHAPDWSEYEWTMARAAAAMHGISPLLATRLRWNGPSPWLDFLQAQREHTEARHRRIKALLGHIDDGARDAGLAVLALKGAALHEAGVYAAGERPMADIDLLVTPADVACCTRVLESLGYRQTYQSWKERVFTPTQARAPAALGENSHNDLKIELHDRICERLPWKITDASHLIFPRDFGPGLNPYPSRSSLMTHLLLHAAGAMTTRALRLLQLHDLSLLSARMRSQDWDQLLETSQPVNSLWWAYPPLQLASRYYGAPIPEQVVEALKARCPWVLRRRAGRWRLFDVSLSYPWVEALPGIEWSHSLQEIPAYAAHRVSPSVGHFVSRRYFTESQAWAADSSWAHLSQGRRILQWLTSRPIRPPTLHAVRAALAQRHVQPN